VEEVKIRRKKLIRDAGIIAISLTIAILIHQLEILEGFVQHTAATYFLFGTFLAGILFASTFTVAVATSIFLILGQAHNPVLIAVVGGLGALVGDTVIFKFLKEDLVHDFEYLEVHFGKKIAKRIFHSKLIFWFAPIVAAIMIASPIPDEIGLIMLAGIKLKYRQFFIISFLMNTLGILVISLFARFS